MIPITKIVKKNRRCKLLHEVVNIYIAVDVLDMRHNLYLIAS